MTRTEAIAIITATLPSLDDESATRLAEIAQSLVQPAPSRRRWTDAELTAVERSKEDFAAGRTYSVSEARASTDDFLAKRGVPRSSP